MIVTRDERTGGLRVWRGMQEAAYRDWERLLAGWDPLDDGEEPERPEPTLELSDAEAGQLTLAYLRGPVGAPGPMGPMGMSAPRA